jgi:hypothetical protein
VGLDGIRTNPKSEMTGVDILMHSDGDACKNSHHKKPERARGVLKTLTTGKAFVKIDQDYGQPKWRSTS